MATARTRAHATSVAAVLAVLVSATASAQVDERISREGLERNAARRVFAVNARPDGPIEMFMVEEVRQQLPPHQYAVRARNRDVPRGRRCTFR